VSELLGALHVTVNLYALWQVLDVPESKRVERIERLIAYGKGCLRLVVAHTEYLTAIGHDLADRLQEVVTTWN